MATYYWVGGTGTWDASSTTNWAASSGGAGSAGVPTNADDVIIDSSSGTGTITCTSVSATCQNLTVTATQAITLAGTLSLLKGSLSYPSSGSFASTAELRFTATTTGFTINTGSITVANIYFNGVGGEWTLTSALNSTGLINLLNGSFNTGNYNINATTFTSSGTWNKPTFGSTTLIQCWGGGGSGGKAGTPANNTAGGGKSYVTNYSIQ
jgi:hypothetical protein